MGFVVSSNLKILKKYECEDTPCDVVVPGNCTTIGKEAFYEAYNVRSVILEEGVSKIDSSAFCACSMESITLPDSLEEIGYDAFSHCSELENLFLPDGLKKIGKAPFANCSSLNITVSENNNILKVVDGKLFSKNEEKLIFYPLISEEKRYIVPAGTKTICELAFAWNEHITEIVLPEGLKEIKGGAFGECYSLEKIVVPASVTKIEDEFDLICTFEQSVIEAPKASYAIQYAKEKNIRFKEID